MRWSRRRRKRRLPRWFRWTVDLCREWKTGPERDYISGNWLCKSEQCWNLHEDRELYQLDQTVQRQQSSIDSRNYQRTWELAEYGTQFRHNQRHQKVHLSRDQCGSWFRLLKQNLCEKSYFTFYEHIVQTLHTPRYTSRIVCASGFLLALKTVSLCCNYK